jgi:hypothetical protein
VRAKAFLISLIVVPFALPAQAEDSDDLSGWSVEELCENKDKRKHAEAVLAELERRGTFRPFEIELIREGRIDIGASEAALNCSWGEPRGAETLNGEPWQAYYRRAGRHNRRMLVRIDSALVAEIRPARGTSIDPDHISLSHGGEIGDPRPSMSEKVADYDAARQAQEFHDESVSQRELQQ